MKTEEARALLQRYFEAETTTDEERRLNEWFLTADIPEDMKPYGKWFGHLDQPGDLAGVAALEEDTLRLISQQAVVKGRSLRRLWVAASAIAASLVITFATYNHYTEEQGWKDTFDDPAEALAYAEKTLGFVSAEYDKGLSQLSAIRKLDGAVQSYRNSTKIIDKGLSEISKIQLINKLKD